MRFREYDVVRVIAPIPDARIHGNAGEGVQPRVGDIGAILIVHTVKPGEEPGFIVERTGPGGSTLWMADIFASELEQAPLDVQSGT